MANAFITNLAGPRLAPDERAFLREADPWGVILFPRNIVNPEQVGRLTGDFREALGRSNAPVLIDQDGWRLRTGRPIRPPRSSVASTTAIRRWEWPPPGSEAA
jgi:beta-N-acetylhexosaminidase